jgi:hypothetical protein
VALSVISRDLSSADDGDELSHALLVTSPIYGIRSFEPRLVVFGWGLVNGTIAGECRVR